MINKRIQKDINQLMNDKIQNVHILFNEKDLLNINFLIRGEKDTPYYNGNYIFNMKIPTDYPINPPSVKFLSSDGKTRCHPNFYESGKVCLSIIGTWSGPSWSPIMNLSTVILSIQSLLNVKNPITCEPSFENEPIDSKRAQEYIETASKFNKEYAIKYIKQNPPIEEFKELINSFNYDD